MLTEAQKRATKRYYAKLRQYIVRFKKDSDADVIERIDSQQNKTDYIRNLVRQDIGKQVEK